MDKDALVSIAIYLAYQPRERKDSALKICLKNEYVIRS